MADTNQFVQGQDYYLSGNGISSSDTSIILKSFTFPNSGDTITMADFGGSIGYGTLEPGTAREENISFTGVTQNAGGTATLTGVTRGLDFAAPYTNVAGLQKGHAGNSLFRITNSAPFYNELGAKDNDETVTGVWTFTDTNVPRMDTAHTYGGGEEEYFTTKRYVDNVAIAGVNNGTTTQKGIYESATAAEAAAAAAIGSGDTDASLAITTQLTSNTSSAAQLIPVTDADGDIPVEFMELDATWAFTGTVSMSNTVNISTATNWQLGGVAYTGTMATLNEADTFFTSTDISASEAETLTDGSSADSLHTHTYNEKSNISTSDVTVGNTTTETSLVSYSLSGGVLGTNNAVEIFIPLRAVTTDAAARTLTIRLKYGATTLATATMVCDAGGFPNNGDGYVKAIIAGNGGTSAQKGIVELNIQETTFGSDAGDYGYDVDAGTATEDSTGALTLAVTAQWSDANASTTLTAPMSIAKVIR